MQMTSRDIDILKALAHYYVMSRPQLQSLFFPEDDSGRATRRRMLMLIDGHWVNRQKMLHAQPDGGSPACAYFPSAKGCAFLADETGDYHYRLTPTQSPNPFHIQHWLAITDTHIKLDHALKTQEELSVPTWINEWDIVNKDENEPERRYQLFTLIRENPRLVCAPDAAFLLSFREHKKVYYLEQDRATSGIQQVAGSKTRGYAVMAETGLHRRHFPETTMNSFTVMMVVPTDRRRDSLRAAIACKPGAALWKFAVATDLKPETFLYEPIWYPCDGAPTPLVKRKV